MPSTTGASPARWRCTGARWRAARPAATRRCGGSAARAPASAPGSSRRRGSGLPSISLRTKSNSTCEAEGKPTSISLKPIATSVSNMRSLRAMSIGSISAWLPSRRSTLHQIGRLGQHGVGPGAVVQADGGEGAVLAGGLLQHGMDLSRVVGKPATPKQNGPLLVQTGR